MSYVVNNYKFVVLFKLWKKSVYIMNNVKEIRFEYVVKYVWFEVVDIYIFVGISVEYSNVKFNCC